MWHECLRLHTLMQCCTQWLWVHQCIIQYVDWQPRIWTESDDRKIEADFKCGALIGNALHLILIPYLSRHHYHSDGEEGATVWSLKRSRIIPMFYGQIDKSEVIS